MANIWWPLSLLRRSAYYYQVTAVNSVGESGLSGEVSAAPQAALTSIAIDAGGGAAGSFSVDTGSSGGSTCSTGDATNTRCQASFPCPRP